MAQVDASRFLANLQTLFAPTIADGQEFIAYIDGESNSLVIQGENILYPSSGNAHFSDLTSQIQNLRNKADYVENLCNAIPGFITNIETISGEFDEASVFAFDILYFDFLYLREKLAALEQKINSIENIFYSKNNSEFQNSNELSATGKVTGVTVNSTGFDNPAPYQNISYSPVNDGFIIVQKDNLGKNGIKTYLYDKGKHNVLCYPLCSVDPDACDNSKILQIVQSLLPSLSDAFQLVAVKKIEGYKIIVT